MNRSRRKLTSCSAVPSSSPSEPAHCATLFHFPISFPSFPFLSSSFFFSFLLPFRFLFSLFLFVFFFLSYSSFLSSLTELIHSLPLSILVTNGFHVSPSHSFPLTSVLHDTSISFPCDTGPPSFFPCGIHHPHGPSYDGHDAVWHHVTCHLIICSFHLEIHEIPIGSKFNVIHQSR